MNSRFLQQEILLLGFSLSFSLSLSLSLSLGNNIAGPLPRSWMKAQWELQRKILHRYRSLGIVSQLPGIILCFLSSSFFSFFFSLSLHRCRS